MAYYSELGDIKSELGIAEGTVTDDDFLYAMMDEAKELIDNYCNRKFDKVTAGTRYFDGAGSTLFIDPISTITTVKLDEDGDGTFESTLATTDYIAYPLNEDTKHSLKISNNSNYGGFASGVKQGVQIIGTWGYAHVPYPVSRASKILVVTMYNNRKTRGKKSETLGDYSYSADTDITGSALPLEVRQLLDPYRRFN